MLLRDRGTLCPSPATLQAHWPPFQSHRHPSPLLLRSPPLDRRRLFIGIVPLVGILQTDLSLENVPWATFFSRTSPSLSLAVDFPKRAVVFLGHSLAVGAAGLPLLCVASACLPRCLPRAQGPPPSPSPTRTRTPRGPPETVPGSLTRLLEADGDTRAENGASVTRNLHPAWGSGAPGRCGGGQRRAAAMRAAEAAAHRLEGPGPPLIGPAVHGSASLSPLGPRPWPEQGRLPCTLRLCDERFGVRLNAAGVRSVELGSPEPHFLRDSLKPGFVVCFPFFFFP